ncbi:12554_t:CDS:2, partial [Ambispora leptoticha]
MKNFNNQLVRAYVDVDILDNVPPSYIGRICPMYNTRKCRSEETSTQQSQNPPELKYSLIFDSHPAEDVYETQSLIDSHGKMFDANLAIREWKSLTATIFGAQNVRIGHLTKSKSDTITIHNIKGGFYIDTPGFDDSDEDKNDEEFNENLVQTSTKYYNGNVWDNTIIVTKGDTINNGPRDRSQRKFKCSKKLIQGANPSSYLDTGIAVTITMLIHEDASMFINAAAKIID